VNAFSEAKCFDAYAPGEIQTHDLCLRRAYPIEARIACDGDRLVLAAAGLVRRAG
jgi:hypothetical protein